MQTLFEQLGRFSALFPTENQALDGYFLKEYDIENWQVSNWHKSTIANAILHCE